MGLLSANADYSDRDQASLEARLSGLIDSTFPTWSDKSKADFGDILLSAFAFVGDALNFYQDNNARESRITTAQLRRNMLALVKLIGYVPAGASAAQSTVTFTLSAPVIAGRTVTFNAPTTPTPTNPTTAKTNDIDNPIDFQLIGSAVVITAGNTTGSGTMENSVNQGPETFTSTGLANQSYALAQTPFLDASAVITAGDGTYTRVDNFLQSTSTDRHFTSVVDDNDKATITFGNGTSGKIPVGTITVNYKTGGGSDGTIITNSLVIQGNYVDSTGAPVTVTITNTAASGSDRDTVEQIREEAPLSLRALTRTVAREDYEIHAKQVSGVERAAMLTRNEDPTVVENTGKLIIVPSSLGFPTQALKNSVLAVVGRIGTKPCTVSFSPVPTDPLYLDIGLTATLFLKPGYVATTVRDAIRAALVAFFALRITKTDGSDGGSNPKIDFGLNLKNAAGIASGLFPLSDVMNVVRDVDGVFRLGPNNADFQLSAYRVVTTTLAYTGGLAPATLVQALAHTDVAVAVYDFPRLKKTVLGGAVLDVDLTIDGINYPPS